MEPAHSTLTESDEFEPTHFAGSPWATIISMDRPSWAWRPGRSNSTTDHPISCRHG
jgi:hypothetical protein